MKMTHRMVWLALVLLLSAALSACGVKKEEGAAASEQNQSGNTEGGAASVKLRIMWWGPQSRHDATLKALEAYTKKNPHVTFEPEFQGFDGYIDKLTTQAAARNTPDIFQMDPAWFKDWAASNRLADLSAVNVEDVDPNLLSTGTYDGKLYAVPLGNNAWGIIYNKAIFEKAGIPLPEDNWTWDDFFRLIREAKPKLAKDQYLVKDLTTDGGFYSAYQLAKGKGWPRTSDGKFNYDKETWLTWMKTFAEFRKNGLVPPPDVTVSDKQFDAKADLLAQEKVLMRGSHAAEVGGFDSLKPGQLAVIPAPSDQQGSSWLKASMYWSVSPDREHEDEAIKFIDWFINSTEAADILTTSRGVPVSKKMLSHLEPKFSDVDKMGIDLINRVAQNAQTFDPGPGSKGGWSKFDKEYENIVQMVMFDKITPEQAWEEVVKISKEIEN